MGPSPAALLLDDLNRLCMEPGGQASPAEPPEAAPFEGWPPMATAGATTHLLSGLRTALATVADAHGLDLQSDPSIRRGVRAVLDGAQLAARTELLIGDAEGVRRLIPTFVFLIVLPLAGESAAHRAHERASAGLSAGADDVPHPAEGRPRQEDRGAANPTQALTRSGSLRRAGQRLSDGTSSEPGDSRRRTAGAKRGS